MPFKLIMLRHGQSTWNKENLFTGWVDVPLSEWGKTEAEDAGRRLAQSGHLPDVVYTSLLRRAINTANAALDAANRHWIPVTRTWRLNERHYGDLQGKNKAEAAQDFGDNQVKLWRRSYDTRPPPMRDEAYAAQQADAQYGSIGEQTPRTECLEDVLARMLPFWESDIVPELRRGNTVLVVAHGNSLRSLVKVLDERTDDEIVNEEIPTGVPILYELDDMLKPIVKGGKVLDL
ncbi:hypothetical protein LMH87_001348 [Akanthomyces muscarius]|uniref:Phosphoglycerate mutase n=1 Tax=Akanthomyces muscarius TaxID=2231603 RepID=A0A9W8QJ72_AKAMU|nr:hypothetical protein LMH87_001348 [Akanthomyces muscarius]KAJ4156135.1 hypothetical protein LMH87_001348 [Akanthomyces muscarius]